MKLILTEYNINLKDWDINYIKQVEKIYSKVLRNIQDRKWELLSDIPSPNVLLSPLASS